MSDSFTLLFSGSIVDVQRVKAILEENDIYPIIKDESESARLAGFGAPSMMQQLLVLDSEVEKAKSLL
jgi:hypothetical protein